MRRHFRRSEEDNKRIDETTQTENYSNESKLQPESPTPDVISQPESHLYDFEQNVVDELHSRWNSIQAQFVDQPCSSIEQADALIADALDRIHQSLIDEQELLRDRWYEHEDVSTEDLRLTLQDYRTFLNNLLGK